jgi:hypothetical protein
MLEFPPHPLPPNVNSPPYVLFGINGSECFTDLPDKIPLELVLHFAPRLREWLLPAPTDLPKESVNIEFLTPYIGIDIQHSAVTVDGLSWIIKRMLQLSGRPVPKETFDTTTFSLPICLSIHRTWAALDLPPAGLDSLRTHILMRLMFGPPVTLMDMRIIWDSFPHTNSIVREMAVNYMRAHARMLYSHEEYAEKREWSGKSKERRRCFKEWEKLVPEFGTRIDVQRKLASYEEKAYGKGTGKEEEGDSEVVVPIGPEILEMGATKRVSLRERKTRERNDVNALQQRLSRVRSGESLRSVETVIWDVPTPIPDPPPQGREKIEKAKKEATVDADSLTEKLSNLLMLQPIAYRGKQGR